MKMHKLIISLSLMILCAGVSNAQEVIRKVDNVTILNLDAYDAQIPYWGEKNLMIFYIDPDRAGQNQKFTEDLEASGRAMGDNLVGLGVVNFKDAPFIPNGLVRSIIKKRTQKNKAIVLADQTRTLSKEWELGDCNNLFVTILINRNGEIVYLHKGEFSPEEEEKFLNLVDILK